MLFKIVKITPVQCLTEDPSSKAGTCMSGQDCDSVGGVASGSCARGFGTCCLSEFNRGWF